MHHQHFPTLIHGFPVRAHRVFKRRALSKRLSPPKRRRPNRVRVPGIIPTRPPPAIAHMYDPNVIANTLGPSLSPPSLAVARRNHSRRARPSRRAPRPRSPPGATTRSRRYRRTQADSRRLEVHRRRAVVMPRLVVASEELHDASRQAFPSMIVFAIDHGEGFRHVFARAKTRKSSE